jgi:ABC-type glycerol-3-phosphate transport system substrate-binding protein
MANHHLLDPSSTPTAPGESPALAAPAISRTDLLKKGVALAAGLGLGLAATPALAARPVRPSRAQVTLRFAGVRTFAPNGRSPWPVLIAEFEKQNPTIKVEFIQMQSFSESTTNHEFLVTNLASGGGHLDVLTGDVI